MSGKGVGGYCVLLGYLPFRPDDARALGLIRVIVRVLRQHALAPVGPCPDWNLERLSKDEQLQPVGAGAMVDGGKPPTKRSPRRGHAANHKPVQAVASLEHGEDCPPV